jgi:hypothetical protein
MIRSLALACLSGFAMAAAACAPVPADTAQAAPAPGAPPVVTADSSCAAQGGTMRPVCRMRTVQCVVKHPDAGKPCRDKADCAGRCLSSNMTTPPGTPTTGQCADNNDPCGCRQEVRGGVATAALCVD